MVKTIVITGGTSGIGEAIVREFHKQGAVVVIGSRHDSGLAKKLGPRVSFQKMDVRDEKGHRQLVQKALNKTGRLDVYINCAGFSSWRPINEINESFWNEMIDINLKGTFLGCKAASQFLGRGGCIINISSLAGKRGSSNNAAYCAAKFGVTGLTQALAKELGSRGIRVNAVCPVYVETKNLIKTLNDKRSPASGKNIKKFLKEFALNQAALKRLPLASEVAKTCLFLASDDASAVTGQSLNVDCGVLPQ